MSEIVKSQWATDGDYMRLSMPLAKVDRENRLVSGFATLDNVDSQGDIVTSEASTKAFSRARGNIREMHQPIAVGKIVDFREDEFVTVDPQTGETKFYRGIFVTAYVSKGAEATWEKVLDGTLTGFSIGGNILEADNEYDAEIGKSVRFIKDYELIELSLVDNPANQLANVFSITKASNGSVTVKGMAVETEIENVFWCKNDQRVQAVAAENADCVTCGDKMDNIGWFEQGGDRAEKVRNVVTKFLGLNNTEEGEGGVVEVSDSVAKSETPVEGSPAAESTTENVETENVAVDSEPAVPNVTPAPEDRPADETVAVVNEEANTASLQDEADETVDPDEVPDEQEEIAKKIDALHEAVNTSLEKTRTETAEQVAALEDKIAAVTESFTQKASELESKFSEFGDKLEAAKSRFAELEKALEIVNSSEAVKKSGDIDSPEPVQKSASVWNGAFSVDNLLG